MTHPVVLVDDHHMVREGLAATIDAFDDYAVVLQAANGRELIDAIDGIPDPAIAIVDLHMPVMDGYATIAWLKAHRPAVLPLALTFDASEEALMRAIRAGARGFLGKNARSAVLKHALDSLVRTGYFQTSEARLELLDRNGVRSRTEQERDAILAQITPRELDLLRLVCSDEELTYEQIAGLMKLSVHTVDNYRVNLFEKFGIKSKAGLVLFAYKWRIVEP
ncbi:MAG TPA: response regulator transcription factor [Flavobacteriales bacterium]|nr:response regulator transcription factor [Flavobacteriales bacterium]HMR28897.1 response regulator transcription factor [Flavobacteriales bacterium]